MFDNATYCIYFKLCPLTYVLGDQQEEDEIDSSNKVWEESFPTAEEEVIPEKKKPLTDKIVSALRLFDTCY